MISVHQHWSRYKVHTQRTCRKQQPERLFLHSGVITLMFVHLLAEITNEMFNTIHILEQASTDSNITTIYCHNKK